MKAQEFNFAFDFLRKAVEMPTAIALRTPTAQMTYLQVRDQVVGYARQLAARGVDRTSCVMLDANRLPEGLVLGLAVAALGARWVRASSDVPLEGLGVSHVVALSQPEVIPHRNFHLVTREWADVSGLANTTVQLPGYSSPDDIASFAASSGTTGRVKYIGKSYRVMTARILQSSQEGASLFCLFGALSGAGFHAFTSALINGSSIIVSAPGIAGLAELGNRTRVLASPAQLETFIGAAAPPRTRLPLLIAKGSVVGPALLHDWLRCFEVVEIDYGSQEVGLVGSTRIEEGSEAAEEGRLAYRNFTGVTFEVTDPGGQPCPAGIEGVVRIRTPSMVSQYAASSADTAEAFREGWFYPGDLGSITPDGRLIIRGRIKDQFNFGGIKINAADIDAAVDKADGVRAAVSFARSNARGLSELCVVAVIDHDAIPQAAALELRRSCANLRGGDLSLVAVYFVNEIPLNENGKPARDVARQMAESMTAY